MIVNMFRQTITGTCWLYVRAEKHSLDLSNINKKKSQFYAKESITRTIDTFLASHRHQIQISTLAYITHQRCYFQRYPKFQIVDNHMCIVYNEIGETV